MEKLIMTDVVDCEIPLLLSKRSLKKSKSVLDFYNDVLIMNNEKIALQNTSNGHYCVPLVSKSITYITELTSFEQNNEDNPSSLNDPNIIYINHNDLSTTNKKKKRTIALKLHQQFGHPINSDKL